MTIRSSAWGALLLVVVLVPSAARALLTAGDSVTVDFNTAAEIGNFDVVRDDTPSEPTLNIAQNAAQGTGTPASGGLEAINVGTVNNANDLAALYVPGGTASNTAHIRLNAGETVTLSLNFFTSDASQAATPRLGIASVADVNMATTNGTVLTINGGKDIIGGTTANNHADGIAVNIATGGDKTFNISDVVGGGGRTLIPDPNGPYDLLNGTWYQFIADITKSTTADVFAVSAVLNQLNVDGTSLSGQIGSLAATITNADLYGDDLIAGFTVVHNGTPVTVSNEYDDFSIQVVAPTPSAPLILTPPLSQDVVLGNDATLSVTASGTAPLAYQWRLAGADIPGQTNSVLAITNAGEGGSGPFSVSVTNGLGSTLSPDAFLRYAGPELLPAQQVVFKFNPLDIAPDLLDGPGRSYQWRKDAVDLSGATNATLHVAAASASSGGDYLLVYTLGGHTVTSATAKVIVPQEPTETYTDLVIGDMPRAYWRLGEATGATVATEEIALVATGGLVGDYGTNAVTGEVGALLDDINTAMRCLGNTNSLVEVTANSDILTTLAIPPPFSAETWALAEGGQGTFRSPFAYVDWLNATVIDGWTFFANDQNRWEFRTGEGIVNSPDTTAWNIIEGPPVEIGQWTHLVGVHDGTHMMFYVNGVVVGTLTNAAYSPIGTSIVPSTIGGGSALDGGLGTTGDYWIGKVDEPAVYGIALSEDQILKHYAAAFPLNALPIIDTQPQHATVLEGVGASFFVAANSVTPVAYQWLYNGGAIPDETNDTLQIAASLTTHAGGYSVIVDNNGGSVTSDVAVLTVLDHAVGSTLNVSFLGFINADERIGANGGNAGIVDSSSWMEIGANTTTTAAPIGGLFDDRDALTGITVSWSAKTNRRGNWSPLVNGNHAMLTGFIESRDTFGNTNNPPATLVISNIPPAYTSVGYDVIVYLGAPAGAEHARYDASVSNFMAGVSTGSQTFYYHAVDGRTWDGLTWIQATTTDPGVTPPDANYAEFTGLTAATLTLTVDGHPTLLEGPGTLSGFQIVPGRSPMASTMSIGQAGGIITVDWTGDGVLQSANALRAEDWSDVSGGAVTNAPYPVPAPQAIDNFRLRAP